MSIRNIGYTDSYGGLISAMEARALTEKGKEDIKLRRLDNLSNMIKSCTAGGDYKTGCILSAEEAAIFRGLDYKLKQTGDHYDISWEDSPASEPTNNSGKENLSSSGEVVASLPIATEVAPVEIP